MKLFNFSIRAEDKFDFLYIHITLIVLWILSYEIIMAWNVCLFPAHFLQDWLNPLRTFHLQKDNHRTDDEKITIEDMFVFNI
jgi:hypothetical protein